MENLLDENHGYQIKNQNAKHFVTFTICGWIDLFSRKIYRDIVVDSLKFCQENKGLELNAFVIMTNHVHLIIRASGNNKLSDIVRDFKKYTHKQMIAVIDSEKESRRLWMLHQFKYYASRHKKNELFQIWTNDNHPEECYSEDFTLTKLNYIHNNPVRAGFVKEPHEYIYSSAINYLGKKGIIKVDLL